MNQMERCKRETVITSLSVPGLQPSLCVSAFRGVSRWLAWCQLARRACAA
jgi:hypothetical protein